MACNGGPVLRAGMGIRGPATPRIEAVTLCIHYHAAQNLCLQTLKGNWYALLAFGPDTQRAHGLTQRSYSTGIVLSKHGAKIRAFHF